MASPADRAPDRAPSIERARAALRANHLFDAAIIFWRGTSGHAYVHTVYTLVGCPAVPQASVIFVRRCEDGHRVALGVQCVDHEAPSLNLAQIRQSGAQLGANEVHLHFATGNRLARQNAAFDLHTRHSGVELVGG